MPLFMVQMFHGLGNGWAASLLGFVSVAMVCVISLTLRHELTWHTDPDTVPLLPLWSGYPCSLKACYVDIVPSLHNFIHLCFLGVIVVSSYPS